MKITLTISTTESFTSMPNLVPLVDMALECVSDSEDWSKHFDVATTVKSKTGTYRGGDKLWASGNIFLTVER